MASLVNIYIFYIVWKKLVERQHEVFCHCYWATMKNMAYKTSNERLPIIDIRKELPNLRMILLSLSIAYCFDEFWRKKGGGEKSQTIETTKKKKS